MLTCMWLAARMEGIAPFPYTRFLIRFGPKGTAARLHRLSPELARQFLLTDFPEANFSDDRFLMSCWGTLTARLRPLLTETVIRSFTHSDLTPAELMLSRQPVTWYIRLNEQDLLALSPCSGCSGVQPLTNSPPPMTPGQGRVATPSCCSLTKADGCRFPISMMPPQRSAAGA